MRQVQGLPGGTDDKESACNAEHPGSSLGWKDLLEKGMATQSNILAWRILWTEEAGAYSPWGCKESDMIERLTISLTD